MDINKMSQRIYTEERKDSLEGKILVASPHLDDPYFSKSLIYICAHDSAGAIGIIINQRIGIISHSDFLLHKANEKMRSKDIPLMFGGPVNTEMLIALSLNREDTSDVLNHSDLIVHTDVVHFLGSVKGGKGKKNKFLLAKGISAWDNEQLEEEIAENSWFVVEPSAKLIFDNKPKNKWNNIIQNLGIGKAHGLVQYSGNG